MWPLFIRTPEHPEVRFLNDVGLDLGPNLQNWGSIFALKNPQGRLDSSLDF